MVYQGLIRDDVEEIWRPFLDWVAMAPADYVFETPFGILDLPARNLWDAGYLQEHYPDLIVMDNRPGASASNYFWTATQKETGQFLHAYHSTWLSASLLGEDRVIALTEAIFAASRHWSFSLHFKKGLAGAPTSELEASRDTAVNPLALDAFAFAIIAGEGPPSFPEIAGYTPDIAAVRSRARAMQLAMDELAKVVDSRGTYLAESSFFEPNWQQAFWGVNYPRLKLIKESYDQDGLFFIHHGVGSENWSSDGFTKMA